MREQNSMICQLCQKVLAHDEVSEHHCDAWCGESEQEKEVQDNETER